MKPTYTPNDENIDATTRAVFSAYQKSDEELQAFMQEWAQKLIAYVKSKSVRTQLSMDGAMEVVCKCAMEATKERK